jgi:hypothetical protein
MSNTFHIQNPISFNNRLIVERYIKGDLRHRERNGFALIDQKLNLKGLKVLANAYLTGGVIIQKDSIAYVKEESLHTQPWAQKALESEVIGVPFLIIDLANVELIVPPKEESKPEPDSIK